MMTSSLSIFKDFFSIATLYFIPLTTLAVGVLSKILQKVLSLSVIPNFQENTGILPTLIVIISSKGVSR